MQRKSASRPSRIRRAPRCIPKMFDTRAFISSFSRFATATSVANRQDMSTAADSRKMILLYTDSPCATRRRAWVVVASSAVANACKIACSGWRAQLNVTSLDNKPGRRSTCNLAKTESFSSNILNNLCEGASTLNCIDLLVNCSLDKGEVDPRGHFTCPRAL